MEAIYFKPKKNIFTGEISFEKMNCKVIKKVSNLSVKIFIYALKKESTVRISNIKWFIDSNIEIKLPYKD